MPLEIERDGRNAHASVILLCLLAEACTRGAAAGPKCPDEDRLWATSSNAMADRIYDVVAGSATSAYAVGRNSLRRWDGCRWSQAPAPPIPFEMSYPNIHAWASPRGDLWLAVSPYGNPGQVVPPADRARLLHF